MANVVSLGVHTPAALPFLVAEGILSEDPSPNQYKWHIYEDEDDDLDNHKLDEIVSTDYCVVWSRGGIVQKTFRFEVEEQKIKHAVLTYFKSAEFLTQASQTDSDSPGGGTQDLRQRIPLKQSAKWKKSPRKSFTSNQSTWRQSDFDGNHSASGRHSGKSRALVVLLSSQAHVYFLSGTSHVVNLPFEVEKVLPAPWGLVLQRKLSSKNTPQASSTLPPAPSNSFISSQLLSSQTSPTVPRSQNSKAPMFQFGAPATGSESVVKDGLPRLFTLTNPLAELGLVVSEGPLSSSAYSHSSRKGIKSPYEPLDSAEEIVFISTSNEISGISGPNDEALILVVTLNRDTCVCTIWYALYSDPKPLSSLKPAHAPSLSESTSRRRSSFNPGAGTGTTTPAIRPRDNTRESFAGDHRLGEPSAPAAQRTAPGESLPQSQLSQNAEDAFASQVDPDFPGPRNPAHESRRISSFISRADLSTGPERSNFADVSKGNSQTGVNLGSLGRRGHSLGGQNERRSFGGLSSIRSRASTPGSTSRLSFLEDDPIVNDQPGLPSLDFLTTDFGSLEFQEPLDSLPKEVAFVKVRSIPIDNEGPRLSQSYNADRSIEPNVHVFAIRTPKLNSANTKDGYGFNLYILDKNTHQLVVAGLTLSRSSFQAIISGKHTKRQTEEERFVMVPEIEGVRRFSSFQDIAKIRTPSTTNILSLTDSKSGTDIHLHDCYSFEVPLQLSIDTLKLFNPFDLIPNLSPSRREAGLKRTIKPQNVRSLRHAHSGGLVDLLDPDGSHHRLQIQLQPRSDTWNKVLEVCQCVFPIDEAEHVRLFWCAAFKWLLKTIAHPVDVESTATCITLFSMFVGRMEPQKKTLGGASQAHGSAHGTKGSAAHQDTSQNSKKTGDPWSLMMASEFQHGTVGTWNATAWGWAADSVKNHSTSLRSPAKSTRAATSTPTSGNPLIREALGLTRRFLAEDVWAKTTAARIGWTGPLDDNQLSRRAMINGVVTRGLHLLREESKLNVLVRENDSGEMKLLAPIIAQMGHWLGWQFWDWRIGNYYELEGARSSEWMFEDCKPANFYLQDPAIVSRETHGGNVPNPCTDIPRTPHRVVPVMSLTIENTARFTQSLDPASSEPPSILKFIEDALAGRSADPYPSLDYLRGLVRLSNSGFSSSSPRSFAYTRSITPRSHAIICYLTDRELENAPSPIHVQKMEKYGIDANMLETLPVGIAAPLKEHIVVCQASPPTTWGEKLLRLIDREDLYLLATERSDRQMDPITIPNHSVTAVSDMHSVCRFTNRPEHHRSPWKETYAISRLIFSEDKRYAEANNILEPQKPPVAECQPNPQWSEAEYLDAQKEVMQWVMVRTTALYPGSAMIHFDGTHPMLTERFFLPGFSTLCVMKPLNNTVSADRSSLTEEKLSWAFFHAGVARGLSIAIEAEGIDTSWIVFNKPNELTNRHAGLLLALGLNGHLRPMAKWLAFKYLTPKHTMTSIGLLLGLSASFLGTMDQLVTRLLSVHVTKMLPEGAAELNVSSMTQTAGLMGIGLLYYDTQHRRMSEVMLSEIQHIEFEDVSSGSPDVLRDESYRLAAGFALGFINLAQGKDLRGLHNMDLVGRLLDVAVGPKAVNIIHIIDQATAGATIAIGLIFMKSGDIALAKKIDIPDTLPQFDYIRPDLFLLRTLAKHLIMWDSIRADQKWIRQNILADYRSMTDLSTIRSLKSEHMPFYNTLAGLLWSISLKYAGSGDVNVRDFLVGYLDQFIRLCKLPALRYDARLTRNTVRNCQDLLALATATVMAGRGDLIVFRRLRLLHGRVHAEVPYGSHIAVHLALGALFLGSGRYTFGTSKLAVAALVCAFYPLFPTSVLDNKGHLQAFRHFWVLAAEARCLVVRDVDSHRAIPLPITVLQRSGTVLHLKAPVLLPELNTISQVKTNSPEYWQVTLDFAANPAHVASFQKNQTVFVRRRPASEAHGSTFHATLVALNDAQSSQTAKQMWNWIFNLPVFSSSARFSLLAFDQADWTSVLPADTHSSANLEMKNTVVDTRLALSKSVNGWERDDLMQLRMLFAWAERVMVEEGGRLRWLGREVVDGLKVRVAERVKELESDSS